jgi:hypothetical protein
MMAIVTYTHYAYFSDRSSAEQCARELTADWFVCEVKPNSDPTLQFAVRAIREVDTERLAQRHGEVEALVQRYGGEYGGGLVSAPGVDQIIKP